MSQGVGLSCHRSVHIYRDAPLVEKCSPICLNMSVLSRIDKSYLFLVLCKFLVF